MSARVPLLGYLRARAVLAASRVPARRRPCLRPVRRPTFLARTAVPRQGHGVPLPCDRPGADGVAWWADRSAWLPAQVRRLASAVDVVGGRRGGCGAPERPGSVGRPA